MPLRGGNWNNGTNAGVFELNLNNSRALSNDNVGFRSALLSWSDAEDLRVFSQYREDKGACFHAERQKIIYLCMPRVGYENRKAQTSEVRSEKDSESV